jgi:glycosyltransferase involved in cell wall biosynthesis
MVIAPALYEKHRAQHHEAVLHNALGALAEIFFAMAVRRPPIIAFAASHWAERTWMDREYVLSHLAGRAWRAVYTQGALSVWSRRSAAWRDAGWRGRFQLQAGVLIHCPGRIWVRWPKVTSWDRLVLQRHVREVLTPVSPEWRKSGIAFFYHPVFLPYLPYLGARYVVYHAYDAHGSQLAELEAELVAQAHLVTAASRPIADQLPGGGRNRARILSNGVDLALMQADADKPCPDDLAPIPRPRIAYIGTINQKVDLQLIAQLAERRPSGHWVLIGHVQSRDLETNDHRACMSYPNVHFLGHKPRLEVPAYMHHTDVNTMVYRLQGGWWEHGYPLKMHEYLAVGRPIVSTDIASVRPFREGIALARTLDDWEQALEHAIHSGGIGTPETRRAVAEQNTWDKRVDQLEQWLFEIID